MAAVRKLLFADRFEIEGEAGAGGAGTVYRARDVATGERVALKVLRAPMDAGAERFVREARALARLGHAAVVRYISHGVTEEGEPYLVMEWLEGQDLRRHLLDRGLTLAETVALGERVAGALAAVHERGVLHRDVKPSNLFLVGGDVAEVKLIDFGLVRLDEVSHSLTRSGVAVGTPGYMSPEQARGDREVDPRADVFSLGCVLFKCLTGRAPFEGDHLVAVLTKVLLSTAPRVRELRPDVPEALDALVARMLAKDPASRPQSAAEVAATLRSLPVDALDAGTSAPRPASFSGLTDSEQRIGTVLLLGSGEAGGAEPWASTTDAAISAHTLLGRATPFLGREWELSTIASQVAACIDEGRAAGLVFTAPAGLGKSRLAAEAVEALRRAHPELDVWVARADRAREGCTLGLLGQALRAASDIHEGQPPAEQRRRLTARVGALLPEGDAGRVAELLGEIASVPFPAEGSPELQAVRADPQLAGEQMRRAFLDFLGAACFARPVLLVVDDLQWSDAPSLRFVDAALDHLEHAPWMVLAFARPELDDRFLRLWAGRSVQRLRLKPLSPRPTEKLARLALGAEADSAVIARVVGLAEGNVFFLEELIRAVAVARKRSPGAAVPLPPTVLAMVQARLDGLDPGSRKVLRAASVFGDAFWPGGVGALLGNTSAPADDWVERLVAGELLVRRPESRFPGELELSFRHALLREGAYATLTGPDRAAGHLAAAAWLAQRGARDPLVLARHLERGGDDAGAAVHLLRASEQALRASDLDEAAAHADRALALGLRGPGRLAALGLRCEAEMWRGDWPTAAATAQEVLATATPGSVPWARAAVAHHGYAFMSGRSADFIAALGALWSTEPEPDAVSTVLYALHSAMLNLCLGARFVTAARLLQRIDALAARLPEVDATTAGRLHLCHQLVDALGSGRPERALRRAEAARECYQRAGDAAHVAWAQLFVAIDCWQIGAFDRARREMSAIVAAGPRAALTAMTRVPYEGLLLIDAGALPEARALAEQLTEGGAGMPPVIASVREGTACWLLAEVALASGDAAAAEQGARAACERLAGYPLFHTSAEVLLADALLAQGRGAEALAAVRRPLASLEEQGGRGFRAARTRVIAALALAATGDTAEARRVLSLAQADLLARAAGIGDAELRRGFLEHVPENARTLSLARAWHVDPPAGPPDVDHRA